MKKSDYRQIESFEDLRRKKKELEHEIKMTGSQVTSATEHLIDEGVKIIAVGVAGFLISRILGTFMSSRKNTGPSTAYASAQSATTSEGESKQHKAESSAGDGADSPDHESDDGHNGASTLDTALVWLNTISGGIEAARVILNTVAEKQQADSEGSTEETKTG